MVRGGSKAIEGAYEERRRNMKRKNAAALLSLAAALMLLLAGCGQNETSVQTQTNESYSTDNDSAPAVYMTEDVSPQGLMAVYEAMEAFPGENPAIKISTGEPGSNYLRTDLIGSFVQSFENPTIVECNTAYGGSRASTAMHYQVAEDHGYTEIADVDIMDENGSMTLPVRGGDNLTENYVGANFEKRTSYAGAGREDRAGKPQLQSGECE